MPTFTKLLAIRSVAKRCFGDSNKLIINSLVLLFFNLKLFICVGDSEKKAISEPEITAEQATSTNTTRKPIIIGSVRGFIKIPVIKNVASEIEPSSSKILLKLVQQKAVNFCKCIISPNIKLEVFIHHHHKSIND